MRKFITLCGFIFLIAFSASAQVSVMDSGIVKALPHIDKFYVGTGFDAGIFSTATIQEKEGGVMTNKTGTLRFSYVLNAGLTFNFNFGRHFGAYTGIDIKNIGFIEKNEAAQTVKRRTYNIGAPLGIKVGNMAPRRSYGFLGGGADVPINYREKTFAIRDQKTTFSEWFSDRTPALMPYIFAGMAMHRGLSLKVQYYPNNFLNPSYTTKGTQPYADYDVHLILVSLGVAVPLRKKHDMVKAQVNETHLM